LEQGLEASEAGRRAASHLSTNPTSPPDGTSAMPWTRGGHVSQDPGEAGAVGGIHPVEGHRPVGGPPGRGVRPHRRPQGPGGGTWGRDGGSRVWPLGRDAQKRGTGGDGGHMGQRETTSRKLWPRKKTWTRAWEKDDLQWQGKWDRTMTAGCGFLTQKSSNGVLAGQPDSQTSGGL